MLNRRGFIGTIAALCAVPKALLAKSKGVVAGAGGDRVVGYGTPLSYWSSQPLTRERFHRAVSDIRAKEFTLTVARKLEWTVHDLFGGATGKWPLFQMDSRNGGYTVRIIIDDDDVTSTDWTLRAVIPRR